MTIAHRILLPLALLSALLATLLVYWPGLDGPFLFDDRPNILHNPTIPMERIEAQALADAFYGGGSFRRGLVRVSFALNHFAAGGFDARAFKLTNVAIHLLSGVLVYFLCAALLRTPALASFTPGGARPLSTSTWRASVALFAAAIWMLHPIQLTSVLYVVQRMTSLAGLFVFSGLLLYVHGRLRVVDGRAGGFTLMVSGLIGGVGLGVLCKENAVLLPLLAFVVEWCLFGWPRKHSPRRMALLRFHTLFFLVPGVAGIVGLVLLWPRILEDYASVRDFTLGERLLTQPRVLGLYLGLFFAPALRRFGLYHDDLVTSAGLFEPLTSVLALTALIVLGVLAVIYCRRAHVWAFALLFFLAGHVMESSAIALEMVHEHRNYVPSFALAFAASWYLARAALAFSRPALLAGVAGLAILATLSMVTFARASIWGNESVLARYMVAHHPDSYRAQAQLARVLAVEGGSAQDMLITYREVARSNEFSIFPLIRMLRIVSELHFQVEHGLLLSDSREIPPEAVHEVGWGPDVLYLDAPHLAAVAAALNREIDARLRDAVLWVETLVEFDQVHVCMRRRSAQCIGLLDDALRWTEVALAHARMGPRGRAEVLILRGRFLALRGDIDEAIALAHEAAALEPENLMHELNVVVLLGRAGRFEEAEARLAAISAHTPRGRGARGVIEAGRLLAMLRAGGHDAQESTAVPDASEIGAGPDLGPDLGLPVPASWR